jgi:hypothetical protein
MVRDTRETLGGLDIYCAYMPTVRRHASRGGGAADHFTPSDMALGKTRWTLRSQHTHLRT